MTPNAFCDAPLATGLTFCWTKEIDNLDNDKVFGEEIVVNDMHTRKALMNKLVLSRQHVTHDAGLETHTCSNGFGRHYRFSHSI